MKNITAILLTTIIIGLVGNDVYAKGHSGLGMKGFSTSSYEHTSGSSIRVQGYPKPSTGTYVMPHSRSTPDEYKTNNWSTKGNGNPYTGKKGYKKY